MSKTEPGRLVGLDTPALRTLYTELLQCNAPPSMSPEFLLGHIAWAIQARDAGQSPSKLRRRLTRVAARLGKPNRTPTCLPGVRLVREWHAHTYEVTVLDEGFLWQGRRYRSLSRIAMEITGAKWSGPRFFGLRDKRRG